MEKLKKSLIKWLIKIQEKKIKLFGCTVRFILKKYNSDILIVVFQACHSNGAHYNYYRILKECKVNKLWVKDDFSPNHRGSYYLGEKGKNNVESTVYCLIEKIIKKRKIRKVIFVGSSKGGYAALNFGITYPNSYIVIAAPQYKLGTYLDCEYQMLNLLDIIGSYDKQKILDLDNRLADKIKENANKNQKIYIHYSDCEHTYDEHVKYLIEDLKSINIYVEEDIEHYKIHGELYKYFPSYLVKTLSDII